MVNSEFTLPTFSRLLDCRHILKAKGGKELVDPAAQIHETARLMQVSVAPVFLISAVGVLLGSMTVRYGRVIDRMRRLLDDLSANVPPKNKRIDYHLELRGLYKRARLLRSTIILAASSIFCIALTIFILFGELITGVSLHFMPEVVFSISLIVLLAALGMFINDFAISLHYFKIEVRGRLSDQEFELHHSKQLGKDSLDGEKVLPP